MGDASFSLRKIPTLRRKRGERVGQALRKSPPKQSLDGAPSNTGIATRCCDAAPSAEEQVPHRSSDRFGMTSTSGEFGSVRNASRRSKFAELPTSLSRPLC
jgi:hypothetical protein